MLREEILKIPITRKKKKCPCVVLNVNWTCGGDHVTYIHTCVHACSVASVMSDSLLPHVPYPIRLLCLRDFASKNTGVGCHTLLQGIFPTQGSNLHPLHCRQILYHWATREDLYIHISNCYMVHLKLNQHIVNYTSIFKKCFPTPTHTLEQETTPSDGLWYVDIMASYYT